jgi:hypothetical protein
LSRGRPAAQPEPGYNPPPRLLTSVGRCTVVFTPETGSEVKVFDFTELPVGTGLQHEFAVAFEEHTGPGGRIKSVATAVKTFYLLKRFCAVLATQRTVPSAVADLRPGHLDEYLLSQANRATGRMNLGVIRAILLRMSGLTPELRAKCAEWIPGRRDLMVARSSYTHAEEKAILDAARGRVRAAARRIRATRDLLRKWQDGDADLTSDPLANEYCSLLDRMALTGDVPRSNTSGSPKGYIAKRHGGVAALGAAVHLGWEDTAALIMLLVRLTGENGSTIARAPAAHHRPDGGTGRIASLQVDIDKPRRTNLRYSTATWTDIPSWASAPEGGRELSARDELHTAFGVYMLALELTEYARASTERPELLQYWRIKQGRGFATAEEHHASDWGRTLGLSEDPAGPADPHAPAALEVGTGRMRTTFMARERRPTGHTPQTHADTYLRRDRTATREYQHVVAGVLATEVAKARQAGSVAMMSAEDLARVVREPQEIAARLGVTIGVLEEIAAGQADTVLAACTDNEHSPFSEPGQPCRASFLKCLECPCARALPHHLPIQIAAHDAIAQRRAAMPALRWAQRFAAPHAQLADLLDQAGKDAVRSARRTITDDHRHLVERLLRRELDQA